MQENKYFIWTDELAIQFVLWCAAGHQKKNLEMFKNQYQNNVFNAEFHSTLDQANIHAKPKQELSPDYIITAFVFCSKDIYAIRPDGNYSMYPDGTWFDKEYLLTHDWYKIYSIKRISDNQEFKIGDEVVMSSGVSYEIVKPIAEFKIDRNDILISDGEKYSCHLSRTKKKEREVLFTTKDGVKIYEGDSYWYVNTAWHIGNINYYKGEEPEERKYRTYFSTEKAAEEWILKNKPLFSINDIISNSVYPIVQEDKDMCRQISENKLLDLKQKLSK
jgi:hypothetical protein